MNKLLWSLEFLLWLFFWTNTQNYWKNGNKISFKISEDSWTNKTKFNTKILNSNEHKINQCATEWPISRNKELLHKIDLESDQIICMKDFMHNIIFCFNFLLAHVLRIDTRCVILWKNKKSHIYKKYIKLLCCKIINDYNTWEK